MIDYKIDEMKGRSSRERVLDLQEVLYKNIKKHVRFMMALFLE